MAAELTAPARGDGLGRIAGRPLLEIEGLRVSATTPRGEVPLLHGIDLVVPATARVGVVGESGSGKSMTASAILGLLPAGVHVTGGALRFRRRDLLGLDERQP